MVVAGLLKKGNVVRESIFIPDGFMLLTINGKRYLATLKSCNCGLGSSNLLSK